jgi:Ca2+/H+ antiporter, TMEM165/GDT1 family
MRKFWLKRGLMFIAFFIVALLVFGTIVKALWNAILPDVTGVKAITFKQAIGLLVLSKILFSGFGTRGGWRRGRYNEWRNKMQEKLGNMTAEEREKFRTEWKNRCGQRDWRTDRRDRTDNEGS